MSIEFKGEGYRFLITLQEMYSDGTPLIKFDIEEVARNANTIVVKQSSLGEFVNAMFLVDSIEHLGGKITTLILPFLPGARQDRVNSTGDVLFTSKSVAEMINARGFYRVITVDPHSEVMPSFINNLLVYPLYEVYADLGGYDGVIAPDKGAWRRAQEAADTLGLSVTTASKVRDEATGRLSGFDVTVEAGKHYIVIDDICDGGFTFIGLGEKIAEQGATADLYVTHAIFTKGTDALKEYYQNIYTTNSRNNGHNFLDVIRLDVVTEMENY